MKTKIFIFLSLIFLCFIVVLSYALWPMKIRTISTENINFNNLKLKKEGKYLADVGDCTSCHTSIRDKELAGGRLISSPIGNMYSSNITPDKKTGIGNYTFEQFDRAVRHGVRADGVTLYPAMPYPSFSLVTDQDMIALYAYFMNEVQPISQENRPHEIIWPLSIRWPVAIWRKIFTPDANIVAFKAEIYPNSVVARGAYLVQGFGHCGTCHTPRTSTLHEKGLTEETVTYLSGGQVIDNWYAPSLRSGADGLGHWSENDIVATLKVGRNEKNIVLGIGMIDVVRYSTQYMTDNDQHAIATYLKVLPNQMPSSTISYNPQAIDDESHQTQSFITDNFLYRQNCISCHNFQGRGRKNLFPAIAGNSTVLSPNPVSLIRLILEGYKVPNFNSELLPMHMPGFERKLSDREIATIATFIRQNWGNQAPDITEKEVKTIRDNLKKPSLL